VHPLRLLLWPVAACHGDTSESPQGVPAQKSLKPPLVVKKGPSAAEQTRRHMVSAGQPAGNSVLPILVKFDLAEAAYRGPDFGDSILPVVPQITAAAGTFQIAGSQGLGLVPAESRNRHSSHRRPKQDFRRKITVTPTAEGSCSWAWTAGRSSHARTHRIRE